MIMKIGSYVRVLMGIYPGHFGNIDYFKIYTYIYYDIDKHLLIIKFYSLWWGYFTVNPT